MLCSIKSNSLLDSFLGGNLFLPLFEEIEWGVFCCDQKGELTYYNKPFAQMFFLEQQPIALEKLFSQLPEMKEQIGMVLNTGKHFYGEGKEYYLPTQKKYLNFQLAPLKTPYGEIIGVWGLAEDVSSKKELEFSLKEKLKKLSIINEIGKVLGTTLKLEEILEIILIGATAGPGLGFNRAFLFLLNEEENCLEGKMAIGPSDADEAGRIWSEIEKKNPTLYELLKGYNQSLSKKDVWVNRLVKQIKISLEDGEHILIQALPKKEPAKFDKQKTESASLTFFELIDTDCFALVPLIAKNKILGLLLADNKISQKEIKEEDLKFLQIFAHQVSRAIESSQLYEKLAWQVSELEKTNQKLAEASARMVRVERLSVLGEITSQVAHQLRNPLTIIGGFAHSVLKKMNPEEVNYEYLQIICQEVNRIENVLNNVLNFTKTELGRREKVDLNEITEQTLDLLALDSQSNKISIHKSFESNLPEITVNPELTQQAILNILRNAVNAMPRGGTINISTRKTEDSVQIEISDTGVGIEKEQLPNIFSAFFTTKPDANGLGLTITQEIIRNQGGNIGVQSQKGKGASFFIELPIKKIEGGENEQSFDCR
jgi:signal transduction histidine kinase